VNTLFIAFSVLTLVPALLLVLSRNAVSGAMFMILSFVGLAGLFVLLEAFLLAILQILVYAGAVMVLFLFIIMLLDVRENEKLIRPKSIGFGASLVAGLLLVGVLFLSLVTSGALDGAAAVPLAPVEALPTADDPFAFTTSAKSYGYGLFTKYMLPFQMVGVLLLIAMIGVVVISKRYQEVDSRAS